MLYWWQILTKINYNPKLHQQKNKCKRHLIQFNKQNETKENNCTIIIIIIIFFPFSCLTFSHVQIVDYLYQYQIHFVKILSALLVLSSHLKSRSKIIPTSPLFYCPLSYLSYLSLSSIIIMCIYSFYLIFFYIVYVSISINTSISISASIHSCSCNQCTIFTILNLSSSFLLYSIIIIIISFNC